MTPKEAVAAAFADNRHWMGTHAGIVRFILSEQKLNDEGNVEYDNVILSNPEEARNEARLRDAEGRTFQVQLTLCVPKSAWARAYGNELNAEGVQEFLQNALFISTDHVAVSVQSIVPQN